MTFNQLKFSIAFVFITGLLQGQDKVWTIDECVNYAVENNLSVRQAALQTEISKNNLQSSKWDYAPNLNFSTNLGWNFGLNIDPVTNEISQNRRTTSSMALSSNWVLYDGGRKYNTIDRSNLDYLAAMYSLEDVKNDIRLNVASAFLQVLLNKEIREVASEQVKITDLQLKRMVRLVEAGARPKGDQLQLEAQLARDNQNLIAAENAIVIGRLQLANLLQLEEPDALRISSPDLEAPEAVLLLREPSSVYATAVEQQPGIKGAQKNLESSEEGVAISKSGALPTLTLNGQIGTSYSDQVMVPGSINTIAIPIPYFDGNGDVDFLSQNQIIPSDFSTKPISDQYSDNLNEYVGINLTIPIFNRFSVRNNYQNAKINREISKLQLEQEKNILKQTIYQAHADAKASYNTYLAAQKSVTANEESFKYAQERFNVGALNQFDYENARNNLVAVQSEMLRAKYDYIFKIKVIEFYLTNQIKL